MFGRALHSINLCTGRLINELVSKDIRDELIPYRAGLKDMQTRQLLGPPSKRGPKDSMTEKQYLIGIELSM